MLVAVKLLTALGVGTITGGVTETTGAADEATRGGADETTPAGVLAATVAGRENFWRTAQVAGSSP